MEKIEIYLSDYNMMNTWCGDWFEITCKEDVQQAIDTCRKNEVEEILCNDIETETFTYAQLGGENAAHYLLENIDMFLEILDNDIPEPVLAWAIDYYDMKDVADKCKNLCYDMVEKEDSLISDDALVGHHFAKHLQMDDSVRFYFDHEKYGRDMLMDYSITEDDQYLYLIHNNQKGGQGI